MCHFSATTRDNETLVSELWSYNSSNVNKLPDKPVVSPHGAENMETEALTRLNELGRKLSRVGELEDGLKTILSATIALVGASKGNIQMLDRERGVLTIATQYGFDRDFLETFRQVSTVDDSACGRALRLRRLVLVEDTDAEPSYARFRAAARAAGYRAVISAPIMGCDERPVGMISVHFPSPRQLAEPERRLLGLYVRQAAEFLQRFISPSTEQAVAPNRLADNHPS